MIDNTQSKKCVHCGEEATVWSPTCQVHVMGTDTHMIERERDALRNERDHLKQIWGDACEHVAEACEMLGGERDKEPLDTWKLRELCSRTGYALAAARASEKAMGEALRQAALDLGNVAAMAMLGEQIPAALVSNMEKQARCALAPPVLPPPHPTDCATPEMEAERAAVFDAAVRMMRTKPAEAQPHIVVDPERRVFAMEPPPSPVMPQAKGTCDRCKGTGWYKVPGGIEARCLHSISPSGDSSSSRAADCEPECPYCGSKEPK